MLSEPSLSGISDPTLEQNGKGDIVTGMANPNPSPDTRFEAGKSGNPGGKSAEHVAAERKAAEISALMRLQVLSSMQDRVTKITEAPDASLDDILKLLDGDVLRLFKDSEDRAHGTPKQSVEHGGEGGGPLMVVIQRFGEK